MIRSPTLHIKFLLALALLLSIARTNVVAGTIASSPVATFFVTTTNDSGPGSLREAIVDANTAPGVDLISITTSGTVQLLSPLPIIIEPVTIQGPGANLFAVDGNHSFRVLDSSADNVTLSDITVQNGTVSGTTEHGAGIRSTGSLSLNNVDVLSNTAQSHGGGLYTSGELTITNGIFQNNLSTNGIGGGLRSLGTTIISGTQSIGNSSQGDGGGVYALGELTLTTGLFQENTCTAGSCDGGGLFSFGQTNIHSTQFESNTAQDQGGGAAVQGVLTMTSGLFQNNRAVFGTGGGLFAQNIATIQDTQILSNTARSFGGGMYALATAVLTDVLFQDNLSTMTSGGGLYTGGSVTLDRVQFIRNTAREGGGLYHALGDAFLANTLFVENIATDLPGMAMLFASEETAEVLHVTVAGPPVASGTGIEVVAGTAEIKNTIITSHTVGINNTGASVQQDFNLFFGNGTDIQGTGSGGANSLTGDPLFADPVVGDYHLTMGSPAIDAGTDAGVTADFDGHPRPLDSGFDIGFDEVDASQIPTPGTYSLYFPLIRR